MSLLVSASALLVVVVGSGDISSSFLVADLRTHQRSPFGAGGHPSSTPFAADGVRLGRAGVCGRVAGYKACMTEHDAATSRPLGEFATTTDAVPVLIADRYRLEERIGVGAMGVVWRAADELLGRTVAMKELLAVPTGESGPELEESRLRILREGRIGARLHHPHVISMFDVVIHEDRPWLVMEYLPSESLAARLTREGRCRRSRPRTSAARWPTGWPRLISRVSCTAT